MRLAAAEVRRRARLALERAGMQPDAAQLVARVLVDADEHGHESHGVALLPLYLDRIAQGGIDPTARPVVKSVGIAAEVIDAKGGAGPVAAWLAAERAGALAQRAGIGGVAVRGNNHIGMLGAYRVPFASAGIIGLIFNVSGPSVAPPGGRSAALGNNALAMVVPQGDEEPFVVDLAMGQVACGKIRTVAACGGEVPLGWLLDSDGEPTTNPRALDEGGAVPVFGGYKGLCISLLVEVLGGILGGGTISPHVRRQRLVLDEPQQCSQLFVGLAPVAFGDAKVGSLVSELRATVHRAYADPSDTSPRFPGEAETAARRRVESGIELSAELAAILSGL